MSTADLATGGAIGILSKFNQVGGVNDVALVVAHHDHHNATLVRHKLRLRVEVFPVLFRVFGEVTKSNDGNRRPPLDFEAAVEVNPVHGPRLFNVLDSIHIVKLVYLKLSQSQASLEESGRGIFHPVPYE